jgi:hypothetical protein
MMTPERKAQWDKRVKELNKFRLHMLVTLYKRLQKERGLTTVYGPQAHHLRKTDLITEILRFEFPEM